MNERKAQAELSRKYLLDLMRLTPHLGEIKDMYGHTLAERSGIVAKLARQFIENKNFWHDPAFIPTLDLYVRAHYAFECSSRDDPVQQLLRRANIYEAVDLGAKMRGESEEQYLVRIEIHQNLLTRAFIHGECRYLLDIKRILMIPEEHRNGYVNQYMDRLKILKMNLVTHDTSSGRAVDTTLIWNGREIVPSGVVY